MSTKRVILIKEKAKNEKNINAKKNYQKTRPKCMLVGVVKGTNATPTWIRELLYMVNDTNAGHESVNHTQRSMNKMQVGQ